MLQEALPAPPSVAPRPSHHANEVKCPDCGRIRRSSLGDRHAKCSQCRKRKIDVEVIEEDKENVNPQRRVKNHLMSVLQSDRKHKPFGELHQTQRRMRVHDVKAFADLTNTPLMAVQPAPIPAANLVHLPTSTRRTIRTIDGIEVASEKKIKEYKLHLAQEYGTATAGINSNGVSGAYITDPIHLIHHITKKSPFICVGGDAGGNITKLGVTYLDAQGTANFAALLVYADSDHYDSIAKLAQPRLTPFTGLLCDSAAGSLEICSLLVP